jgi:zinc-ribbon domain
MAERESGQPEFAEGARPFAATSFLQRAVIRRRVRFLRRRRELALYDLGGFLFESHRLGEPRENLLAEKLVALSALDDELAMLQSALDLREELAVLHEPGIAACPECGTLHDSAANFCPHCGLAVGAQARLQAVPEAAADVTLQMAVADPVPADGEPTPAAGGEATAPLAVADPLPADGEAAPEASAQIAAADHSPATAPGAPGEPPTTATDTRP